VTLRSSAIGLALVLVICGFGYFSLYVARLPEIIDGSMPVIVFAVLTVMVLIVNPLLGRVRPGWACSGRELAVIVAVGMAVCSYTGLSFFRTFGTMSVYPSHFNKTRATWQATQVLSYAPGHVGLVAEGQLQRPTELATRVVAEAGLPTAAGRLWHAAGEEGRGDWIAAAAAQGQDAAWRRKVTGLVNRALTDPRFVDDAAITDEHARLMAGRRQLQQELSAYITPPPPGVGILLNDGHYHDGLMDSFLFGGGADGLPDPARVPWRAWRPVIVTWVGLMAILVTIAFCLAVVVRPQWANHERLAFPIVRFAELMMARRPDQLLPDVARQRLFWVGFAVVGLHAVNGLNAWFPAFPRIRMDLDLNALHVLMPNASRTWHLRGLLNPHLYLTVIAFSFLMPRPISLSFGLANVVFLLIFSSLTARGIDTNVAGLGVSFDSLLNFGGMIGMVAVMLYTGRRYYAQTASAALLGLHRRGEAPASAVWAMRLAAALVPLAVCHLAWRGFSPLSATITVGVVLLLWLVNARIVCETGLFRMGIIIWPAGVAAALLGPEAIGPTQLMVITMAGVLLATGLHETPMSYAVMGLELLRRQGVPQHRAAPGLLAVACLGLAVALVASLAVQHHYGALGRDESAGEARNTLAQNESARLATTLAATDSLVASARWSDVDRLRHMAPTPQAVGWITAGVVLFALCAVARLRLPWWPLHPVMFVVLGNWGIVTFGFSFLLGWLIKDAVLRLGGAGAYQRTLPLMCGVIAGGMFSAAVWLLVGTMYFWITGQAPPTYGVL
jgi:hypothetical protein